MAGVVSAPIVDVGRRRQGSRYTASPAGRRYVAGQSVTVTATLTRWGVRGRRRCRRGGRDVGHDGDVHGDVRRDGVYAGVAGESGGDPGDVCQWGGDDADGALVMTPGDHLRGSAPPVRTTARSTHDGDGDGDGGRRVRLGSVAGPWMPVSTTRRRRCYGDVARRRRATLVTPVAPTVVEAVCRGGVVQPPTLTLATTDGITYTADPAGRRMRMVSR